MKEKTLDDHYRYFLLQSEWFRDSLSKKQNRKLQSQFNISKTLKCYTDQDWVTCDGIKNKNFAKYAESDKKVSKTQSSNIHTHIYVYIYIYILFKFKVDFINFILKIPN